MKKALSRDVSLKGVGDPVVERRKIFEDHKNLISHEFPLKSPTKKRGKTRVRRESKKVLTRKRSFNVLTNRRKIVPKIAISRVSRRKSIFAEKLGAKRPNSGLGQFGMKIKMKKRGKSVSRTKNTITKEDRGKRIIKHNVVESDTELVAGKRIIKEKNNTSSVFKPQKLLKRRIVLFERDPNINIIAGTPGVIEEINSGKGRTPISTRKFRRSHSLRPLFSSSKKKVDYKPSETSCHIHRIKRRYSRSKNRKKSYALPMEINVKKCGVRSAKNDFVVSTPRRPCTRSSVTYNILSWKE